MLLSFANSVSSRDIDLVVRNDYRRKHFRIIDKFIKMYVNATNYLKRLHVCFCTKIVVEIVHIEETIYIGIFLFFMFTDI